MEKQGTLFMEIAIVAFTFIASGIGAVLWYSIKRYITKQDEKYTLVISEFKEYSNVFNDSINLLTVTIQNLTVNNGKLQSSCVEKHKIINHHSRNTDKHIGDLYNKHNEDRDLISDVTANIKGLRVEVRNSAEDISQIKDFLKTKI